MQYSYVAYTADNAVVRGTITAGSESAAEESLLKGGYHPIALERNKASFSLPAFLRPQAKVKLKEVITLAQQLALMLRSGIPLVTSLDTLRGQSASPAMRQTLTTVIQDVRAGTSLAAAVREHPHVFPHLFIQMVGIGERAGDLETMLQQAAGYYKREEAFKKRVQGALFYPAALIAMTVVVGIVMLVFVLPQITGLLESLRVELPITTRMLIGTSDFVRGQGVYLLALLAAGGGGAVAALRKPGPRLAFHRALLGLPLLGPVITAREMARLSRTMGLLLDSGLPLPQILDHVGGLMGNDAIRGTVRDMHEEVVTGRPMAGALAGSPFIPSLFTQMLRTGEMAGSLDANLATLSEVYETELQERLDGVVSMIEPVMTIVIGIAVGGMALSVIMPIFSVMGGLG